VKKPQDASRKSGARKEVVVGGKGTLGTDGKQVTSKAGAKNYTTHYTQKKKSGGRDGNANGERKKGNRMTVARC